MFFKKFTKKCKISIYLSKMLGNLIETLPGVSSVFLKMYLSVYYNLVIISASLERTASASLTRFASSFAASSLSSTANI